MAIDPFDEFEFKPITEGLGFHKKQANGNKTSFSQIPSKESVRKPRIEFALNSMNADIISEPMLRPTPSIKNNSKTNTTVDDILKTLGERKKYDFTEDLKLTQNRELLLKPAHFELAASMLDGMLIIASFLSALIVLLVITKVDLFGNLLTPDEDGMVYYGLAGLFAGLCWIYLVVNRMFLGFTPGEWVFDQRIGKTEQLGTAGYSIRVAIRSTIIIATGLVLFPILSMITRKDFIGKILNVQTMKKA